MKYWFRFYLINFFCFFIYPLRRRKKAPPGSFRRPAGHVLALMSRDPRWIAPVRGACQNARFPPERAFRYSVGVQPSIFLNALMNTCTDPKPDCSATIFTG